MNSDQIKEATRLAAVAMGLEVRWADAWLRWVYGDKTVFDPLNNAAQQLELRRVLRIDVMWLMFLRTWQAESWLTGDKAEITNPNDNLAALMVAAEIGRRKEQANG